MLRASKCLQVGSIKGYLSRIQFFHKLIFGSPSPQIANSQTALLIKCIQKSPSHPPRHQTTHNPKNLNHHGSSPKPHQPPPVTPIYPFSSPLYIPAAPSSSRSFSVCPSATAMTTPTGACICISLPPQQSPLLQSS